MSKLGSNNNTNISMNLKKKKTEQKDRRFSTGNSAMLFTEPKPIPNYLRASIGSCHDFCKYGTKHNFQTKPRPFLTRKSATIFVNEKSDKNHRGKQLLASSSKLEPVSSRKQPSQNKNASTLDQKPWNWKQPKTTSLKGSNNAQTLVRHNEAGKDVIRTSKTSKKNSPLLPSSSSSRSSVKAPPTAKTRTNKSLLPKKAEIKNDVEQQEPEIEKPNYENVPEKIIHMHEPKEEKQDEDLGKATALISSSSNQNQGKDSNRSKALRFLPEEKDTTPRKLRFRRGKVLEIKTGNNDGSMGMGKRLRIIANPDSPFIRKRDEPANNPGLLNTVIEETASKLVKMSRSKVEALVSAFETLIKIQDSDSPRTPKMLHKIS